MIIPIERWYDAIFKRRSRRAYLNKSLTDKEVEHFMGFCQELNDSVNGVKILFVPHDPDKVLKGVIGSYGKVKGAPMFAAFIGDTNDPLVQEKTGYFGESFILEATALGLGTCWVGGFFNPEEVAKHVALGAHEKVIAITPVGYALGEYSFTEKFFYRMASDHKRQELENMCSGLPKNEWPTCIKTALEAARLAPSAVNRQPWSFTVDKDWIKISVDKPDMNSNITKISKRLDCGIAMLHLEIGALGSGAKGDWEYSDGKDIAVFRIRN